MHNLVYVGIKSETVRNMILEHIQRQARRQQAHFVMGKLSYLQTLTVNSLEGNAISRRMEEKPWRKILSDVDDTLFSSGGRYPAGIV